MHQPEDYERYKSYCIRDASIFVPELTSAMKWREGEVIMDYGCGAGSTGSVYLVPLVKQHHSQMVSVDVSEEMVEHAKSHYPDPSVQYIQGDIMTNEFPLFYQQVDKVFSVYVLHFIRNPREFLRRLYNILKPGGYFAFTVLTKSPFFELCRYLFEHKKWKRYMKGYEEFVPDWIERRSEDPGSELEKVSLGNGYEVVRMDTFHMKYVYFGMDEIVGLFLSAVPSIKQFPVEELEDLKKDAIKFLTGRNWAEPERYTYVNFYDVVVGVIRKPGDTDLI